VRQKTMRQGQTGLPRRALALPLAAAALAAACSSKRRKSSSTPSATSAASPSAAPSSTGTSATGGIIIQTAHTRLGTVLTDSKGITVYLFEADTTTKPTCYGACAAAWPPVLTIGAPAAGRQGIAAG
jgi:predicted lipoprotein with Yx(FWY)xxD motif